jgi:hypothetical protein
MHEAVATIVAPIGATSFIAPFPPTPDVTTGNPAGTRRILLLLFLSTIFTGTIQEKRSGPQPESLADPGHDPSA